MRLALLLLATPACVLAPAHDDTPCTLAATFPDGTHYNPDCGTIYFDGDASLAANMEVTPTDHTQASYIDLWYLMPEAPQVDVKYDVHVITLDLYPPTDGDLTERCIARSNDGNVAATVTFKELPNAPTHLAFFGGYHGELIAASDCHVGPVSTWSPDNEVAGGLLTIEF